MAAKRKIHCKFCDRFFYSLSDYASHMEKKHEDLIPEDQSAWQYVYFLKTGKSKGSCIICKKDTKWNETSHKYNRFCENPECKEKYREIFKERMIGKYGKISLLNDPEQQRKMLAARSISGSYLWSDHYHETPYTGSYEKSFLEFLDTILNYDPEDVMGPSPHTYYYIYNNEKHFYIPDFYIPSLNLEIEIKDGGDNPNNHPKILSVDKEKEKLKDALFKSNSSSFNYLKVVNKNNTILLKYLQKAKNNFANGVKGNIVML